MGSCFDPDKALAFKINVCVNKHDFQLQKQVCKGPTLNTLNIILITLKNRMWQFPQHSLTAHPVMGQHVLLLTIYNSNIEVRNRKSLDYTRVFQST